MIIRKKQVKMKLKNFNSLKINELSYPFFSPFRDSKFDFVRFPMNRLRGSFLDNFAHFRGLRLLRLAEPWRFITLKELPMAELRFMRS